MYRKLQVSGLSEIISFTCITAIWDEHPAIHLSQDHASTDYVTDHALMTLHVMH